MKSRNFLILVVIPVMYTLLSGSFVQAASLTGNVELGDRNYPKPNPEPKNFMLFHGTLDSSLDLVFHITWFASDESCYYYTSFIEGATSKYTATWPLAVERNGENFTAKVAIDGVLPGSCGWKFGGINVSGKSGFGTSLVQTNSYPLKPGQSPNGIINDRCELKMRKYPPLIQELNCRWAKPENPHASVLGGVLWWQPQTTDVEVHIQKGTCKLAWCTASDLQ